MTFQEALTAAEAGARITRKKWKGRKYVYVGAPTSPQRKALMQVREGKLEFLPLNNEAIFACDWQVLRGEHHEQD